MKKNALTFVLLVGLVSGMCFSTATIAAEGKAKRNQAAAVEQPKAPTKAGAENRLERLTKALNLTEDQQQKAKECFKTEAQKLKQMRQDKTLGPEKMRAQQLEIRNATNGKIEKLLTAEQKTKWEKMTARKQTALERPKAKQKNQDKPLPKPARKP